MVMETDDTVARSIKLADSPADEDVALDEEAVREGLAAESTLELVDRSLLGVARSTTGGLIEVQSETGSMDSEFTA